MVNRLGGDRRADTGFTRALAGQIAAPARAAHVAAITSGALEATGSLIANMHTWHGGKITNT